MGQSLPQHPPPAQHRPPHRLLALDPGTRRTGVAVSDELGLYAHARPAIPLDGRTSLVEAVARHVQAEGITEVIVGLPLTLAGGDSSQTAAARTLVARLRERLAVPVTAWDERLSSVQAARSAGRAPRKRTGALDSAAAAVVLQAVLDARRGASAP